MIGSELTRRDMLGLIAGCVIASWSGSGSGMGAASRTARIDASLLRMARQLYPHDAVPDSIYMDVLAPLQAALAEEPSGEASLTAGRAALDGAAGGKWLDADAETQIAALRSIASTPFFENVQDAVRDGLYNHPEVWKVIGFEGSSIEYGGYIDRGFADLDWLPED